MRWYADDSDLKTIQDLNFPNIVLFGGICIPYEQELALRNAIETAKSQFGPARSPIKWNFRDLKRKYEQQNQRAVYDSFLENMHDVRKEVFNAASEFDIRIIVGLVEGYSSDKQVLKDAKADLARFVFTNSLMRVALHAQETGANRPEIILDWPDGGESKPYDIEYASAYNSGKTTDGINYHSGTLNSLNFSDSPVYSRMPHNTLLQLADLVVGATREFIHHSISEERKGHGVDLLKRLCHKFRGYPDHVVGRGIVINSRAQNIRSCVSEKFGRLYNEL